jgi:hypothetical protein
METVRHAIIYLSLPLTQSCRTCVARVRTLERCVEPPRTQTSSVAAMDEFVASHSDAEVMENGKIRCTLTGHEVTPQLATVQAYWMGKKYRNAKARREYDYSQHEPYLVPHTKSEHLLYCTLTKQPVRPAALTLAHARHAADSLARSERAATHT